MAEFEMLSEPIGILKTWEADQPPVLAEALDSLDATARFGERHGSWTLSLEWTAVGLWRLAQLAITNPTPTPDAVTREGVFSVRAGASSDERFVMETIYEGRRSTSRLTQDLLIDWISAALSRAQGYAPPSLSDFYQTGTAGGDL